MGVLHHATFPSIKMHRLCYLFVPVATWCLLGSVMDGTERLAFRDVSHFYTPLYHYVAQRTSEQWLPLWNPLDHTGMPLVGETTTAVWYPIRYLLFSLPMPTAQAMGWYIAIHLVLASLTASWAARTSGASQQTAPLAGIVYALSGGVFFLHTNPPFLVSASWLPIALGALVPKNDMRCRARVAFSSIAMAMMILGGDPQSALHAALVAFAVWGVRLAKSWWTQRPVDSRGVRRSFLAIACACVLAGMIAAPQIAASVSWSRQSERVSANDSASWHEPPTAGSRRAQAFDFSLPPWHVIELITPNAWGQLFPINRRVSQAIPGDGRMWTPTIYVGLLAAIVFLSTVCRWRQQGVDTWSAITVAALLLSMGHFGLVWYLQQFPGTLPNTDSAVGGPYWLLYQCLPGYSSFRYPAKWLPVFSLGLSILVATRSEQWSLKTRWALRAGTLLLAMLVGIVLLEKFGGNWIGKFEGRSDEYWGEIDLNGGFTQIQLSLVHSLIVLFVIFALGRLIGDKKSRLGCLCFAALVCVEMTLAMKPTVLAVNVHDEAAVLQTLQEVEDFRESDFLVRGNSGWPETWRHSHSPNRALEVAVAERVSMLGRWHLEQRIACLNSMVSIESSDMKLFWSLANQALRDLDPPKQREFWSQLQDHLGVTVRMSTDGERTGDHALPEFKLLRTQPGEQIRESGEFVYIDKASVPSVDCLPSRVPTVHSAEPGPRAIGQLRDSLSSAVYTQPSSQASETLIHRSVFQDGHWFAQLTNINNDQSRLADVVSVDLIRQGVVVPKGRWKVEFFYAPRWVVPVLAVAVLGFAMWSLGCVWLLVDYRRG